MASIHTFGPFRLDVGARQLTRDGAALAVSARHFDVLVALAARAGTVITKDALVEAAWRDVAVTDNSLEQAVSALRRVLGKSDSGRAYMPIGLGYPAAVRRRIDDARLRQETLALRPGAGQSREIAKITIQQALADTRFLENGVDAQSLDAIPVPDCFKSSQQAAFGLLAVRLTTPHGQRPIRRSARHAPSPAARAPRPGP